MSERPTAPDAPDEPPSYRWKVLVSVVFGVFMIVLDATVVNIAFRTLQADLGADVSSSQWVISVYVLALGIGTPASGWLGDRFGLKRVFLFGLALFTGASILCGLAPSLETLVLARALQGLGGSLGAPLAIAMLFAAFPPKQQGLALGIFGVAVVSAPAIGPLVGGFLVDHGHWRWIFFINGPIGAVGLLVGLRWLKERRSGVREPLDWRGLIASTVGFGAVLYGASMAAKRGWGDPEVLAAFAIGVTALATFAWLELKVVERPLLNLRLFKSGTFTNAVLIGWVSVLALFGAEFLMPLYLQVLRGRAAFDAGLILLPLGLAATVATPLAGRLYDRVGPRPLCLVGFAILCVNTWQFAKLRLDTPTTEISLLLALRGVALGLTVQTTLATALASVRKPQLPRASALVNATRRTVQSISVAILATILAATLGGLGHGAPPEAPGGGALCEPLPAAADLAHFCTSYLHGLENAYFVTFVAACVAFLLALFLPGWPRRWSGREGLQAAPE